MIRAFRLPMLVKCCAVLWILALVCAAERSSVSIASSEREKGITLEASSFAFRPNELRVQEPGRLLLHVNNVSDAQHNFTVKSTDGEIMKSMALPAKETVDVELDLPSVGVYSFYCDKPFHATLGMTGFIKVME